MKNSEEIWLLFIERRDRKIFLLLPTKLMGKEMLCFLLWKIVNAVFYSVLRFARSCCQDTKKVIKDVKEQLVL